MIVILKSEQYAMAKELHKILSRDNDTTIVQHGHYPGLNAEEITKLYFKSMAPALSYNRHVILCGSWIEEIMLENDQECRLLDPHVRMLERCALSRFAIVLSDEEDFGLSCLPILNANEFIADLPVHLSKRNVYKGGGHFAKGNVLILCSNWKIQFTLPNAVVIPYIGFAEKIKDQKTSSFILTEELDRIRLPESQIYWAFVENTEGEPLNAKIIEDLQPSAVVAIGSLPYVWALNNGVNALKVQQPSYNSNFTLENLKGLNDET